MSGIYVVFEKALKDNLKIKYLAIYIAIALLPFLMFANLSEEAKLFSTLNVELRAEYIAGFYTIFSFFWLAGIALAVLAVFICSGFVADELANRTLLLMSSKPIKRTHFILAKFAAFFITALLFAFLSFFFSIYLWASLFNLDIFSFSKFLPFILPLLFYSVFVILVFGSLATALSTIFSTRMKALLPLIAMIMLAFFAFIPIRSAAQSLGVYNKYYLDMLDLGYDLGNIYINMLDSYGIKLIPPMQSVMGTFTGVYKIPRHGLRIDYDHGIILRELEKTRYHSLKHSMVKWLIAPAILLLIGIFLFNRKDVH